MTGDQNKELQHRSPRHVEVMAYGSVASGPSENVRVRWDLRPES